MIYYPRAKINLGLSVLDKRQDGYHNIESFMFTIPFHDVLEIRRSKENTFSYSGLDFDPSQDLLQRYVRKVNEFLELPHVRLHLHKLIPPGKGLGGGSSDLACLVSFYKQFAKKGDETLLSSLAADLSTDTLFFLHGQNALVTGKGDEFQSIPFSITGKFMVLVLPNREVSTESYYKRIGKTEKRMQWAALKDPSRWKGEIRNDFEALYMQDFPWYAEVRQSLYDQEALCVSITGTGSAFFAVFNEKKDLSDLLDEMDYRWMDL